MKSEIKIATDWPHLIDIRFGYNPNVIAQLKNTIPLATWDGGNKDNPYALKRWLAPIDSLAAVNKLFNTNLIAPKLNYNINNINPKLESYQQQSVNKALNDPTELEIHDFRTRKDVFGLIKKSMDPKPKKV